MKTLNQMDETEFLRHCYMIADKVATLLTETQVMELRKVGPILTGSETPDELKAKKEAQGRKNIKAMAKKLLFDNAQNTAELLPLLYELETDKDGNPEKMTPFKTLRVITETINDRDVLDFLSSLVRLVQTDIGGRRIGADEK